MMVINNNLLVYDNHTLSEFGFLLSLKTQMNNC